MNRTPRELLLARLRASVTCLAAIAALPTLASLSAGACARPGTGNEARDGTVAAGSIDTGGSDAPSPPAPVAMLEKSKLEWRELVPRDSYDVLFEEDTERPFSSSLNDEKRPGTFVCAACNLPLFESSAKFDSGTGWPSFYQPIAGHIGERRDTRLLYPRTEYHCARCGGHQGHVFNDGPPPTGQRWCNNGVALQFVPKGDPLPELRR